MRPQRRAIRCHKRRTHRHPSQREKASKQQDARGKRFALDTATTRRVTIRTFICPRPAPPFREVIVICSRKTGLKFERTNSGASRHRTERSAERHISVHVMESLQHNNSTSELIKRTGSEGSAIWAAVCRSALASGVHDETMSLSLRYVKCTDFAKCHLSASQVAKAPQISRKGAESRLRQNVPDHLS